jgi:hypothetical protein
MGNLEFNSQNVTRLLRLTNSTSIWQSNTQTPVQIVQAGYLRDLMLILSGAVTTTTTAITLLDNFAPWGLFNNIQVNSNVQAGVINVSGIGLNWIDQVVMGLEKMGNTFDTSVTATPTTTVDQPQGGPVGTALAQVPSLFQVPLTVQAGASLVLPYYIPLAQKINTLDGYVGVWDLQDPSIQMVLNYTPNSASTSTPFNIVEGTASTGSGLFTQAANVSVIAAPSVDVVRVMYDPPLDPKNDPEFGYVHSWYEELWNTTPGGSSVINWRALANSGYITRLIFGVWDSAATAGVADTKTNLTNSINLTVGNNAPVVVETINENRLRASQELGHQLTQGAFYIDFLGQDLTLQNVLDTFTAGNINLQMNFSSGLGATSTGKVIRGMLQALMQ